MNQTISFAEIKEKFDGEWVLIVDPVTTKDLDIVEGKVLWHSKDRDEVYRKAMEFRPKHSAVLFVGQPPQRMEFAL